MNDQKYMFHSEVYETKALSPCRARITKEGHIEGYASLFGVQDQGNDIVTRGAFTKCFSRNKMPIKLLWQHDSSKPIGVWRDIHEDSKGLFVRGHIIASTQCGFEALELLKAGAIDGLSIGYWIVKSHKSNNGVRYLTEIDLREISLVTFPMLPEARISNYEHQYSSLRPCSTESESQSKGTILQEKISKSPEEQLEESIQLLEQNFYKLIKIMK